VADFLAGIRRGEAGYPTKADPSQTGSNRKAWRMLVGGPPCQVLGNRARKGWGFFLLNAYSPAERDMLCTGVAVQ